MKRRLILLMFLRMMVPILVSGTEQVAPPDAAGEQIPGWHLPTLTELASRARGLTPGTILREVVPDDLLPASWSLRLNGSWTYSLPRGMTFPALNFEPMKRRMRRYAEGTLAFLEQHKTELTRWEYRVVLITHAEEKVEEKLNALGSEGWECFLALPVQGGFRYHFKRRPSSQVQAVLGLLRLLSLGGLLSGGD